MTQRFALGRLFVEPSLMRKLLAAALDERCARWRLGEALAAHARGAWGTTSDADAAIYEYLLFRATGLFGDGHVILSLQAVCGLVVEIVTAADQSSTTVRLAEIRPKRAVHLGNARIATGT